MPWEAAGAPVSSQVSPCNGLREESEAAGPAALGRGQGALPVLSQWENSQLWQLRGIGPEGLCSPWKHLHPGCHWGERQPRGTSTHTDFNSS